MFLNDSCAECFYMELLFLRYVADVQFRVKSTISKRGNFCRLQEEFIKCSIHRNSHACRCYVELHITPIM
jgi:hypothetical protein